MKSSDHIYLFVIFLLIGALIMSYVDRPVDFNYAHRKKIEGMKNKDDKDEKDEKDDKGDSAKRGGVELLNEDLAQKVSDLEDTLRYDKYKKDYTDTASLSKDYLESLKLTCLLELKSIDPKKDSEDKIIEKCKSFAQKITAFQQGVEAIKTI